MPASGDIRVDPLGVGPVGLDDHGVEAELLDQPAGEPGAFEIQLVTPVGRVSQEHETRVADQLQKGVVVSRLALEPVHPGQ